MQINQYSEYSKIAVLNIWKRGGDGHDEDEIFRLLDSGKEVKEYIYAMPQEWELPPTEYLEKLKEYAEKSKFKMTIVTGGLVDSYVKNLWFLTPEEIMTKYSFIKVVSYPWFCLKRTREQLFSQSMNKEYENYPSLFSDQDYKFHFITMNHEPHVWRCEMMDLLAKYNLLNNNAVTWRLFNSRYKFKYWEPETRTLSDNFSELHCTDVSLLPLEYDQSFAQLISESTVYCTFFTEKTTNALAKGKPFLVCGPAGYHENLRKFGFELYDEIFNYSFDSEPDQTKRFEKCIANLLKLSKIPKDQLHLLRDKIKDKLIHNQQRIESIYFDTSFMSEYSYKICEHYEKTGEWLDDGLYSENYVYMNKLREELNKNL